MTDMDMVSKAEVLDIYAELYDEFEDAPGVINVFNKVCDKLKRLQPQDIVIYGHKSKSNTSSFVNSVVLYE